MYDEKYKDFRAGHVIGKNNMYKMRTVLGNPILKALSRDQPEKPYATCGLACVYILAVQCSELPL